MQQIKLEVNFNLPDIDFTEKEQDYFNDLVKDVLKKKGKIGLLSALENYLGL